MFCCNRFNTEIDLTVDSPNSDGDVSVHIGLMYTLALMGIVKDIILCRMLTFQTLEVPYIKELLKRACHLISKWMLAGLYIIVCNESRHNHYHKFAYRKDCSKETCLSDTIRSLALSLKTSEDPLAIEVRRSHIVKDSMKEARKAKFDASKLLKVVGGIWFPCVLMQPFNLLLGSFCW